MTDPATASGVSLRPAATHDAYALWLWANDAATRWASFDRPPVAWADHRRWLTAALQSPAHRVWIAEDPAALPVGCVRFDTRDGWESARLSFVVAPESRGRGVGRALVRDGHARLARECPGSTLLADVRHDNHPSAAIFRALGWTPVAPPDGAPSDALRFATPAVAAAPRPAPVSRP